MKKITLEMQFGRVIYGELKDENENYYQVIIDKVTHPDDLKKFKKVDWQKGDVIKISKDLVKEVKYEN